MSDIPRIIATAFIPFTSLTSFTLYLALHPASPITRLFHKPIALPTHRNEGLDDDPDEVLRDPFELEDPDILEDGKPVNAEAFWASMWRRKIALLLLMIPPFALNVALLVWTALGRDIEGEKTLAMMPYILVVPAHIITILLCIFLLGQQETSAHWPTTVHLSANIAMQFLVLALLALLPSTPLPRPPQDPSQSLMLEAIQSLLPALEDISTFQWLKWALPVAHIPPLLIILFVPRGPALHMDLEIIYPPKITSAIPPLHESLDPEKRNVTGEAQCTVPDWLLFSYATEVVKKGYVSETMDVWDLPTLMSKMRALPRYLAMRRIYGRLTKRLGRMEGFNLLWKLTIANAAPLAAMITLAAVTAAGYYVPHYLLQMFITYLEGDPNRTHPAWGWFLAFALFISNASVYIVSGVIWSLSTTTLEARIKLQLNTLLFAKTLLKKDVAAAGDDSGREKDASADKKEDEKEDNDEEDVQSKSQIMTLFTVDVDRVADFVFHAFALVDSPIEIIVATLFLLQLMGNSALYGLLATLIFLPLNHFAAKVVVKAQENLMKKRDQRTALMNEILQGIRMLKFMAWERPFEERIDEIRQKELFWQARNYQIEVFFNVIWATTPVMVTVISFLHYTLVAGHRLTPSVAFTAVAVFDELRYALNALPETFINALQGFVSCRRIERYMSLAEIQPIEPYDGDGDIVLANATFTWPRDDSATSVTTNGVTRSTAPTPKNAFTLADLSVRFPHGKLSLICGRLGSGKSLLLAGLLGEADLLAGAMSCPRSTPDAMADAAKDKHVLPSQWVIPTMVAYVPQQAWLQNASIRQNIIFNSPWDPERYQKVLEACSLITDLDILEDGDETEIGEKGLNLSGGQKARVSLARAVYSRAGVLLLDDVLSAVDAHTAHAIMENCFQGDIVSGRTILLVSHHTALVSPAAAYIVALENGDVKFSGTRADFVAGGLMKELDVEDPQSPTAPKNPRRPSAIARDVPTIEENIHKPTHKSVVSLSGATVPHSEPDSETSSLAPEDEHTLTSSTPELKSKPPRKLIEDEKRATGRIAWPVWKLYFTALGGPFWWCSFVFGLIIAMLLPIAEKGWLEYWTDPRTGSLHSSTFYVLGYAAVTLGASVLNNIQYGVMYYGSIQASRKLHAAMLQSVLFAKLRFHDTTSRGRLLNRFGKDIEGLDSNMADNFVRSVAYGLAVIVTFASIAFVGGVPFIVAGCLIMVIYYQAGSIYGQTSRDMRRLDSVTRSPLYSMFGETVSGVAVIRAFGSSTIALRQMMQMADTNMLAFAWTWTVNRWLSARFNVLSSLVIGITAVTVLLSGVSASMAGFALAFAGTISHNLLFVVRRFVQLEQSMVALERIKEYSELPLEAPEFVEPRPAASWPSEGAISVEKLVIRYAPDLPNVLHGISFQVAPREKIGVVGATGCGKSTLALSFFRFVEAFEGRIVIDGINIGSIGLTDLRSRVTIIPQDPTILSGTLRSTLDVFDEYDDADIYAALRRVHLLNDDEFNAAEGEGEADEEGRNKNVFRDLSNPVSEGGENFSSGEKQLICMARAILKRNKVLFMDEATASIDYETDELISKTIREEFSDSTILTIAHRIHTIIDFDKVLVMDKGRITEFASPAELLRDHKSRFYGLCKATGRSEFKNLKEMAMEAERTRSGTSASPGR